MAYCHFELCRDCRLECFSELLLANIQRLSMVAVVFLYQLTFLQQNTTASLLELFIMTQCKRSTRAVAAAAAAAAVNKQRSPMGPM